MLSMGQEKVRRLAASLLAVVLLSGLGVKMTAQGHTDALSDAEIEQLRDTNREPNNRLLAFVKFLDERTTRIHDLTVKPRRPGREDDIHEAMEQFLSIADDLSDNLDDYDVRHLDVRKSLPKLQKAIDKWEETLRLPPDDGTYNVSRKLALESIRDLREDTTRMIDSQKAWFLAHPPPKDTEGKPLPPS